MSNKVIILSIHPKWLEKILNGKTTIEIRKTMPKCDLPIDVYIYCCKGRGSNKSPVLCSMIDFDYDIKTQEFIKKDIKFGLNVWKQLVPSFGILDEKIVAKFTLNKVSNILPYIKINGKKSYLNYLNDGGDAYWFNKTCLEELDIENYLGLDKGYCWYIDNLEVFDKPMQLYNFISIRNHERALIKAPLSWCYAYLSSDM